MPAPKTPAKTANKRTTPAKAAAKPAVTAGKPDTSGDAEFVRQLAQIIGDTGLSEIEVKRGDLRVRVARSSGPVFEAAPVAYAPAPVAVHQAPAPAATAPAPQMSTDPAGPSPRAGEEVPSPMVGTVYLQPSPGADAFIKVGDKVAKGQTLLIIEAMKTMNPITAPRDGKVLDILVGDAQPVEYGEALLLLE